MRWLRGAPDGRTCAEGRPQGGGGVRGLPARAPSQGGPSTQQSPWPRAHLGRADSLRGAGGPRGGAGGRAGSRSRASPARICSRRVPRPASRIPDPSSLIPHPASLLPPPLAGLGGLCEALNDLRESTPSGELGRDAEAAFSPSSFERLFCL